MSHFRTKKTNHGIQNGTCTEAEIPAPPKMRIRERKKKKMGQPRAEPRDY